MVLHCAWGCLRTGEWLGDDSDWVRGFVGDIGAALERFGVPLDAKRDLLVGFIVYAMG